MKSVKARIQIDSTREYIQAIKTAFEKLATPATAKSGFEDLEEIMQLHTNNPTRMNLLITVLSEQTKIMAGSQRSEANKVYGLTGEVFGTRLLAYLPKLVSSLKPRWEDPSVHIPLSEAFEAMAQHIFQQSDDPGEDFKAVAKSLLDAVRERQERRESQGNVQTGAAMCLARTLQILPLQDLMNSLDDLAKSLEELFKNPEVNCAVQLLEMLVTLIVSADSLFEEYTEKFIPILIDKMGANQDWLVKKLAIDGISALAEFIPMSLEKRKKHIIRMLKHSKTDKSAHVRKAANEALDKLNEGADDSFELSPARNDRLERAGRNQSGVNTFAEEYKADRRGGMNMTVREEAADEWVTERKRVPTRTPKYKVRFDVRGRSSEDEEPRAGDQARKPASRRSPKRRSEGQCATNVARSRHSSMMRSTDALSGQELKHSLDQIAKVRIPVKW